MAAFSFFFHHWNVRALPTGISFFNLYMMKEKIDTNVKYHIVYKTTNLINGKWYIGKHSTSNLNDDYLGSSQHLKYAIKKYGRDNFVREILVFCDSEQEAYEKEAEFVTIEVVHNPMTYNRMPGGKGSQKRFTDEELKERQRKRQRKWQTVNRDYLREHDHKYYESNREQRLEYGREYYEAHRDEITAKRRARYAKNKCRTHTNR